jgi:2,4-diketo-3-deoxy-L-fuconate hydrolase
VDFEGELGVMIGKRCKDASEQEALSYVAGYCVANDISGRQFQFDEPNGGQWVRSKSFDTFLPLSSTLVPASEVPDPQALRIITTVNGKVIHLLICLARANRTVQTGRPSQKPKRA